MTAHATQHQNKQTTELTDNLTSKWAEDVN